MDEPAIAVVIPAYNASRFLTVVGTGLSAALTALARQETTGMPNGDSTQDYRIEPFLS